MRLANILNPGRHALPFAEPNANSPVGRSAAWAFREGQTHALEALYAEHAGRLRRLALCFGLQSAAADDAVQETFVRAWESRRGAPQEACKLAMWLTSILANHCRDELQRSSVWKRIRGMISRREEPAAADAVTQQENDEAVRIAHLAIRELGATDRMIFVLARVDGLKPAEIAPMVRMTPGAVRVRLFRALQQVRRQVEEQL
jgi:RNA polymerase sigma factor (sigma-70 family)